MAKTTEEKRAAADKTIGRGITEDRPIGKTVKEKKPIARTTIGPGVTLVKIEDGVALLEVDLGATLGISSSGKSILVAKTKGILPGTDLKINLNLYRKNQEYVAAD